MAIEYLASDGKPITKRARYETLRAALWSERDAGFRQHWQELADFTYPRRVRFWAGDRNRGDKRNQNIIDSTGRFAARTLSSGLHAGLTSPARPWMKLTTPDPSLAKFPPVKAWLWDVTARMLAVMATSNIYNVLPLVYLDMGIFGTASMSILPDARDLFRCYSYPIGTFALGLDRRGKATTFVREYEMTVRQVVTEFGLRDDGRTIDWSQISSAVKDLWNNGQYETPIQIAWVVQPNEDANPEKALAKYLPWSSCHFELGSASTNYTGSMDAGIFLRESGFATFPIMAPRWDITDGDSYGTDSPGMTVLGDIKQLQIMQRRKGQLLAKAVDPPLTGPSALRTQKTSLLPGDLTYLDIRDGMQGLKPIHEVRLEGFQHLTGDIHEVQYRIQRGFYEDLFLMLATAERNADSSQPITAREVDERHEEKLLALGPVLERTNDELLDPIVDRIYDLMDRAGLIPPPPPELNRVKLKVEYISVLAQAQKLVGVVSQDRFLQSTAALVQVFPEVKHKIRIFRIVDNYADMLGVDPEIVISDDEANRSLAAQQQQEQSALDAQKAQAVAKAAKDAAAAPMTGDTALNRVVAAAAPNGPAPTPVSSPVPQLVH